MLAALIIIIRKRIGARPSYIHLWDYTLDELRCDALLRLGIVSRVYTANTTSTHVMHVFEVYPEQSR